MLGDDGCRGRRCCSVGGGDGRPNPAPCGPCPVAAAAAATAAVAAAAAAAAAPPAKAEAAAAEAAAAAAAAAAASRGPPAEATAFCRWQDELPLLGKRIAVTAPRNYALRLSEQLVRCGAKPLIMSTVATEPLADYSALDAAIKGLAGYDYVAFTSRNGIEAFLRRVIAVGAAAEVGALLKAGKPCIAALGKDGQALEQVSPPAAAPILLPPGPAGPHAVPYLRRHDRRRAGCRFCSAALADAGGAGADRQGCRLVCCQPSPRQPASSRSCGGGSAALTGWRPGQSPEQSGSE